MSRVVRIPIRTGSSVMPRRVTFANAPASRKAAPSAREQGETAVDEYATAPRPSGTHRDPQSHDETGAPIALEPEKDREPASDESVEMWRDRALRLQAEMDNFRKRQQRLADERVAADRERLLRSFLTVADDLERALNTDRTDVEDLRQGVDLTYQNLLLILEREGAEPVPAKGEPFDPTWHEALGTVSVGHGGAEPDTVVQVMQKGYRLGERLLRPARVIVATDH